MYEKLEMYIDGEWCQGSEDTGEDVINPATEEVLGRLPHASTADLDRAIAAAKRGFAVWRDTSAYDRSIVLNRAADIMRARVDEIARTLTLEQGKVLEQAKIEVTNAADLFQWYAEEGRRAYGRIIPARIPGARQMVVKVPVGPVAAFTAWNFPALLTARKVAGALGAGCSEIIKPSEETPGTTIAMVRALEDAGLPPGVMNIVFGVPAAVSKHLIASPVIKKITFTGSNPVGKHLTMLAAEGMKKTTMELGGHAPVLVFDDVDVDTVAQITVDRKFRNAGQECVSPTRFLVHENVYSHFVNSFAKKTGALKIGSGLDPHADVGPLASARRVEAMEALVQDATGLGAALKTGGERVGNKGFFFAPTVLSDVPDDARVMTEEPFGPLALMQPFSSFDDAVERANALPFGLASYAFTNSTERAGKLSDALESGLVGINHLAIGFSETPFGGLKESGHGSEGGVEGLEAYLVTKFISQLNKANV